MRGHLSLVIAVFAVIGCQTSEPPDLLGYPVNTPEYYTEDKMFFPALLGTKKHTEPIVPLMHVYEIDPTGRTPIKQGNPVAVVLQSVRLPEDLPGGTRDIAVVLDINMDASKGVQPLVAFYQRAVPPGQVLNFNNLLVFAIEEWDSKSPPYFRVRILDVKAERNRRTATLMRSVSNLSGEISGLVPHPIMPMVTRAIDAAGLILSSQRNEVLLDFQVQLYGEEAERGGEAVLGRLLEGQWLILGRRKGHGSEFWAEKLALNRTTDQIVAAEDSKEKRAPDSTKPDVLVPVVKKGDNVPIPYVSVAILGASLQVPKLVMDRSSALISLLSSPNGKTDVDALEAASEELAASMRGYVAERRLVKYRSKLDLQEIIDLFNAHKKALDDQTELIGKHQMRRLIQVMNRATEPTKTFTTYDEIITWWATEGSSGKFVDRESPKQGQLPVQWTWTAGGGT